MPQATWGEAVIPLALAITRCMFGKEQLQEGLLHTGLARLGLAGLAQLGWAGLARLGFHVSAMSNHQSFVSAARLVF